MDNISLVETDKIEEKIQIVMRQTDYTQEIASHTEHMSGNNDLQLATLWDCNWERGQLFFKMTDGSSRDMMVQWTATVFYGSEANC